MATGVRTIANAEALEYELRIDAPPDLVYRFWTEPDRLVRWMGDIATLDPTPGGQFRLEYRTGDVASGSFVEIDPPRRVVFTWGWEEAGATVGPGTSRVEVDLEPLDGKQTLLRVRHVGLPGNSQPSHDEGWRYFLTRLRDAVDQK